MHRTMLKVLPAAIILALGCANAAADEEGFHGYFRVGAGGGSGKGPQSCYGLGGNTMKYRLGNECDAYAEFGYTKEIAKSDGVSYVATIWADVYSPKSDFGDAKLGIAKAFVEAKGLDFLNGGTAWIGKRYYFRPDIHMLDLQYINFNGTGAGVDQVKLGPGKFGYAFFKDNDTNTRDKDTGKIVGTPSAVRQNFIYQDIPANADGSVDVALSLITAQGGDDAGGKKHNGWQVSLFHKQAKVFGGVNTVGLQYGVGPGTGVGVGNGRIGASGYTSLGSDVTRLRLFDDIWVQPTENFGMELVALVQRDKSNAGGSSTWTTLGVRPVYALSKNVKLQLELGTDRVTDSAGPTKRLTKLTLAPTISAGPGLWSRPELRAFVTYGKWNDAATASVNAANNSGPVYNNNTSGVSYGFQVETWF
ncbi:maltoporin [Janthinobacterium fluminis]|uniref:Carbohydrate porin n=1 Tax=Janthinobacterium fluminis TaxID=2987524 RepID=A0ABT5K0N6_9BURK|nr:carbohydrate porin [Janthinobacterium fluminis]MDC8758265.1 carbohydrate porin [Janthinobacterium fluminis]